MTLPDLTLEDRADSLVGWVQQHAKQLSIAAVGAGALVIGAYFYNSSQSTKNVAADQAYARAQQSVVSGNIPLATTDLRRAADRFRGTTGGTLAAFSLAQLLYDQGKYAEGLTALGRVEAKSDAEKASLHALTAAGYEGQKKFAEAAAEYQKAADASKFANEKSTLRASTARALMAAGKKAEAKTLWTELSKDPSSALADEARIRLGELEATAGA